MWTQGKSLWAGWSCLDSSMAVWMKPFCPTCQYPFQPSVSTWLPGSTLALRKPSRLLEPALASTDSAAYPGTGGLVLFGQLDGGVDEAVLPDMPVSVPAIELS